MSSKTYFAYGGDLWMEQMQTRCPHSTFKGVGILNGWKWISNERGAATLIESPGSGVFGFFYDITAEDEVLLDKANSYRAIYTKHDLSVVALGGGVLLTALLYLDAIHITKGLIGEEYLTAIEKGMRGGISQGIPADYFDRSIRPFIPSEAV